MDKSTLLFWATGPAVKLSAAEIAREVMWGEEVDGLIDLPVREILDRLKAEFPDHDEPPGQLLGRAGTGSFAVTWTWQCVRVDCQDVPSEARERLIDAIESFHCAAYENRQSGP